MQACTTYLKYSMLEWMWRPRKEYKIVIEKMSDKKDLPGSAKVRSGKVKEEGRKAYLHQKPTVSKGVDFSFNLWSIETQTIGSRASFCQVNLTHGHKRQRLYYLLH